MYCDRWFVQVPWHRLWSVMLVVAFIRPPPGPPPRGWWECFQYFCKAFVKSRNICLPRTVWYFVLMLIGRGDSRLSYDMEFRQLGTEAPVDVWSVQVGGGYPDLFSAWGRRFIEIWDAIISYGLFPVFVCAFAFWVNVVDFSWVAGRSS